MTSEVSAESPALSHQPCGYLARAWWGDVLVAESRAAVRVREATEDPVLYFPPADVRTEALHSEGRTTTCPVKGQARLWTLEGKVQAGSRDWHDPGGVISVDGRDAVWAFSEPAPGLEWLTGLVAFDHDRVRVEVVDAGPGSDERDTTIKRFPTWGDAADLIDIMNVRPAGERRYVSMTLAGARRPVVEASQMLGQAIVAAGRHAPERRVVSAHMVFYRAADAREPLEFEIDELSAGRSFSTLAVHVSQGGRRRASGTLLLDVTAPDVVRHQAATEPCAGPHDSEPYDMSVTGRDIRMVDAAYTDDPDAPVGPPVIDTWVRFRDVPVDPPLHAGLLTQFTGHISIAAALRPHAGVGQSQAHRTLSTGINAIGISFHAAVRADEWMRYHHLSTFAGDGMTHSECRVHDEAGALVASFTVDAMLRPFAQKAHAADDRLAL
ncbi:hypothetical protein ACG83_00365 [Frankia sp. R43]|uniref:DUF427 domain-containing protein n=1 Tax=unclassified Frankia TaxID=2632575 RepID=UPI0006CA03A1|nr:MULTISPECIES: DUF427 domain-containing protein [unclassified Frankia]KPM56449.1 hypothetical protein ACG83_00365 [Frankia sp. R43]